MLTIVMESPQSAVWVYLYGSEWRGIIIIRIIDYIMTYLLAAIYSILYDKVFANRLRSRFLIPSSPMIFKMKIILIL